MPESLFLTSDFDQITRQEEALAQALRSWPERHVLKKVITGPYRLMTSYMGGVLAAVPGYRYFVHTAAVGAVNTAASACQNVYWVGYVDGSAAALAYAPLIPNANHANNQVNLLDILTDENTSITFGVTGAPIDMNGSITYLLVKVGEE